MWRVGRTRYKARTVGMTGLACLKTGGCTGVRRNLPLQIFIRKLSGGSSSWSDSGAGYPKLYLFPTEDSFLHRVKGEAQAIGEMHVG